MRLLASAVLLPCACFLASPLSAQAVPLVTVDFVAGAGLRTDHSGSLWFKSEGASMTRIGVAVRLGGPSSVRPVLIFDESLDIGSGDRVSICALAPNGSCRAQFPGTAGPAVGAGVRMALGSRVLAGTAVGIGSYSSTIRFADVDLSARFTKHLGVTAGLRHITWTDAAGHRLWFRPVTFGLRVF
jgi:hypothetical protein